MKNWIVVHDLHRLVDHQRHDMRIVHAALLGENDGIGRRIKVIVAQARFHIDGHVGERTVVASDDLREIHSRGMRLHASRFGGHINRFRRWRSAFEHDLPRD